MNDRELLEWAAKAAGYHYKPKNACIVVDGIPGVWNPLDDDGDCARLESAVGIDVAWRGLFVVAEMKDRIFHSYEFFKDYDGDKNRARRYASTKCAAEIGRNMK